MMITRFEKVEFSYQEENGVQYINVRFYLDGKHFVSLRCGTDEYLKEHIDSVKESHLSETQRKSLSKDIYLVRDFAMGRVVAVRLFSEDTKQRKPLPTYDDYDYYEHYHEEVRTRPINRHLGVASYKRSPKCPVARIRR